uniref:EGF-like domain-containing protein n=1 Tax=Branchiostoma floridae TaxID=7739 RepID=C3ZDF5_BRAFL|eukprot:XP_002592750.1 hypothetical protein BRAFLDRAFT_65332 [Branchiostoma floridae]
MTNANVKATCKAAGMKLPCYRRGRDKWGWWAPGCIKFHHAEYITLNALSGELCGRTSGYGSRCQPLDETFVYAAGRDSAFGVEYMSDNAVLGLKGANYNNMYALCAAPTCAKSPCAHGTCTDDVGSYTCSCENGWTGQDCDQDIQDASSCSGRVLDIQDVV